MDDYMEKAHRCAAYHGYENRVDVIATALREAHAAGKAEGMRRAAEIVQSAGDTWSNSRDHYVAVQEAAVDAKCEEIAAAILAEAEKGR